MTQQQQYMKPFSLLLYVLTQLWAGSCVLVVDAEQCAGDRKVWFGQQTIRGSILLVNDSPPHYPTAHVYTVFDVRKFPSFGRLLQQPGKGMIGRFTSQTYSSVHAFNMKGGFDRTQGNAHHQRSSRARGIGRLVKESRYILSHNTLWRGRRPHNKIK